MVKNLRDDIIYMVDADGGHTVEPLYPNTSVLRTPLFSAIREFNIESKLSFTNTFSPIPKF